MRRVWMGVLLPALGIAALAGGGCASPDEPTARHVVVPQAIADLQGHQQGAEVILRFTLPAETTDKKPLAMPPAIEIYRGEIAAGASTKAVAKASTKPIYTIPSEMVDTYRDQGKIMYRDAVDAATLARPRGTVEWLYVIKTRVSRNRASADSNRIVLAVEPPPAPVAGLRARLVKTSGGPLAVILEWPRDAGGVFYLYRSEMAGGDAGSPQGDGSKSVGETPLFMVGEVRLNGSGGDSLAQYQDNRVAIGHTYRYVVRRADESIGPLTVESADSNAVTATVMETQLPTAPEDVQALAFVATATEPAYVSLSWAFASEPGVAGYMVYRSEQAGVRGSRLNAELLPAPAYRDLTVSGGRTYFYTVIAVDGSGQESPAGEQLEIAVPTQ